ncbi:MAG: hypothetical protein QW548_03175 [Candidatus Aenigmatarchaeota archaeon]
MAESPTAQSSQTPSPSSRTKLSLHRKLVAVYSLVGLIVGYVSFLINIPLAALGIMIIVGAVVTMAVKALLKPVAIGGKRWWSSGLTVYVFTWFVVWTILFNVYIVKP